jgi:hypothetical protein
MDGVMSYFELILQRPLENLSALGLILLGFFQVVRLVMNFFFAQENNSKELQVGDQAIISQDNTLQSKLLDEMTARRVSDEQFKRELLDLLDEKASRIDATTLATLADVKAVAAHLKRFDTAFGSIYRKLKAKGVL